MYHLCQCFTTALIVLSNNNGDFIYHLFYLQFVPRTSQLSPGTTCQRPFSSSLSPASQYQIEDALVSLSGTLYTDVCFIATPGHLTDRGCRPRQDVHLCISELMNADNTDHNITVINLEVWNRDEKHFEQLRWTDVNTTTGSHFLLFTPEKKTLCN